MRDFDLDLNPLAYTEVTEGIPASNDDPCPLCGHTNWCYHLPNGGIICGRTEAPPTDYEQRGTAKDGRPIFSPVGTPRPTNKRQTLAEQLLPIRWAPKTDSPQWQATGEKSGKAEESQIEYLYPDPTTGNPLGRVLRKQWSDRRAVYGKKGNPETKEIRPWHWAEPTETMRDAGSTGWWSDRGKGKAPWPLYRQSEAVGAGLLFLVAGEQAVETSRSLGLTAICQQGGEKSIKPVIDFLKNNRPKLLVIWPDHDHAGHDAAKKVKAECDRIGIRVIVLDPVAIWANMPQKGDIHDLVNTSGMTTEQIQQAISVQVEEAVRALDLAVSEVQFQKNHFASTVASGLCWVTYSEDGQESKNRIGNHLEGIAYAQSPDGGGASLYLEFQCLHGELKNWLMPRSLLAGDGTELVGELLARGYNFNRKKKGELLDYLQGLGRIQRRFTITDKTGWQGRSFVQPHQTIGDSTLRFRDITPPTEHPYQVAGTHQDWLDNIGKYASSNSRLIVGLSAQLAGPLLKPLKAESGGIHFFCPTSQGKTTLLSCAASLVGNPTEIIHSWRATDNGLEGVATEHNDLTLLLDEVGQCPPKVVAQVAYLLANGQGKLRANRRGTTNPPKAWQLLFLSTGEVDFVGYLKQAGIAPKGGQEARIIDIPANCEHGVFENLHGFADGAAFSNHLKQASRQYHGTGLPLFLEALVRDMVKLGFIPELRQTWAKNHKTLTASLGTTPDAAVGRVIERLALIALAGDLAGRYGVLPLKAEECLGAVKQVLKAWIAHRGGTGSHDLNQAIEHVKHTLTTNLFSDRVRNIGNADADTVTRNLLAYKKVDQAAKEIELWVPPTVFRAELVTNGVSEKALIEELRRLGWLKGPDSKGKSTLQRWVPSSGNDRFYVFTRTTKEQEGTKND